MKVRDYYLCDFCAKSNGMVKSIVIASGKPKAAAICNECVALAVEIMLSPQPQKVTTNE